MLDVSINNFVFVWVFGDSGKWIVIWFLLKFVLNVGVISGCRWIVLLLINLILNVWILSLCSVGVWFSNIGCLCIIFLSVCYVLLLCFLYLVFVFFFFVLCVSCNLCKINGLNNVIVILWGILYWYIFKFGLIIIIECLE